MGEEHEGVWLTNILPYQAKYYLKHGCKVGYPKRTEAYSSFVLCTVFFVAGAYAPGDWTDEKRASVIQACTAEEEEEDAERERQGLPLPEPTRPKPRFRAPDGEEFVTVAETARAGWKLKDLERLA